MKHESHWTIVDTKSTTRDSTRVQWIGSGDPAADFVEQIDVGLPLT